MRNTKPRGTFQIILGSLLLALAAMGVMTTETDRFNGYSAILGLVLVGIGVWVLLTGLRKRRESFANVERSE